MLVSIKRKEFLNEYDWRMMADRSERGRCRQSEDRTEDGWLWVMGMEDIWSTRLSSYPSSVDRDAEASASIYAL